MRAKVQRERKGDEEVKWGRQNLVRSPVTNRPQVDERIYRRRTRECSRDDGCYRARIYLSRCEDADLGRG